MKKIIFTRNSSKPIPRISRMMSVAIDRGYIPIYIGAKRSADDLSSDVWSSFEVKRVGRYYPSLNGKGFLKLLKGLYYLNVGIYAQLKIEKPEIIHASDYETILPAIIYKIFNKNKVIYNIHDNLHQRYNVNYFLSFILKSFESCFIYFSNITLVPEEFRKKAYFDFVQNKIKVIKNTPNTDLIQKSHVNKFSKSHVDKPVIFYAGWIDYGRGINELLTLAETGLFNVKIAGDGDTILLENIKCNKSVEYLGYLNHQEILNETYTSDFIYAVYKPDRIINRFAASNKIAEALCFGKPVIVNNEMEISKLLNERKTCISFDFERINENANEILSLYLDEERYDAMSIACKNLYHDSYSWEKVRIQIDAVYSLLE